MFEPVYYKGRDMKTIRDLKVAFAWLERVEHTLRAEGLDISRAQEIRLIDASDSELDEMLVYQSFGVEDFSSVCAFDMSLSWGFCLKVDFLSDMCPVRAFVHLEDAYVAHFVDYAAGDDRFVVRHGAVDALDKSLCCVDCVEKFGVPIETQVQSMELVRLIARAFKNEVQAEIEGRHPSC